MLGSPAPPPSSGWNPAALSRLPQRAAPGLDAYAEPGRHRRWSRQAPDLLADRRRRPTAAARDTPWQNVGHDGSAAQYPEWARTEGHANALTDLTSQAFWARSRPPEGRVPRVPLRRLPHHEGGRQARHRGRADASRRSTASPASAATLRTTRAPPRAPGTTSSTTRSGRSGQRRRHQRQQPVRRVPQRGDPGGHHGFAGRRDPSSDEGDDGRLRRHRRVLPSRASTRASASSATCRRRAGAAARSSWAPTTRSTSSRLRRPTTCCRSRWPP